MSATARQVVKNCGFCLTRQETSCFETTISTKIVSTAPSNSNTQKVPNESKEEQMESSVKGDLSAKPDGNELPFTVTEEVENPVEEDPGLEFDVGTIFSDGKNLMEECEILKAQRFWDRVEILVFSPNENMKKEDGRGRHKNYTIVALDSFSKWPEVKKLDKINEQTISQFIIQLISRFGIMNQLVILENDLMMEQSLITSGITQNLSMFNVIVMLERYNPYDVNWSRICKCVSQFVQTYPSSWSSCLDLCLMPLRNSVPPKTDYTPAFVVMGREPAFPSFLFPHRDSLSSAETMLNQEQIETATNGLMIKYLECCEADVKQVIAPLDSIPVKMTNPLSFIKEESVGVRRSGRKVTLSQRLADYDHVLPSMSGQADGVMDVDNADAHSNDTENGDDMTQCVPLKKRKHIGFTSFTKEMVPPSDDTSNPNNEIMPRIEVLNPKKCDAEDVLNKLDSCTFYQVLKLYIEKSEYPLNSPVTFKRIVRKAREMYSMEDGKLIYNHKNKTKKTVLMTMKERLQVLDKIHTSTDDHVPRSRMLDLIDQRMMYWKNFGGDVDAYVKACPNCKHGKPRPRVKKRSGKKWLMDKNSDDEDDWSVGEKYQDRVSSFYPDLIEFLESGVGPSHLSRSELVIFKKNAKNFKLVKGELFYCALSTASKNKGRKVIANEDQRSEVMQKAHGDTHQPANVMLTEIKKLYYWCSMWSDVENFVQSCCQSEMETNKDKTDDLSQKVELFARHFKGEDISSEKIDLDSLFPEMNVCTDVPNNEFLDCKTGQLTWKMQQKQEIGSNDMVNESSGIVIDVAGLLPDQPVTTAMSTSDDSNPLSAPVNIVKLALDGSSMTTITSTSNVTPSVLHYNITPASSTVELDNLKIECEDNGKVQEFEIELVDDSKLEQGMDEEEEEEEEGEVFEKGDDTLALAQNLKSKNVRGEKIRCEICRKILRGENNLKEHMYKHNGIKPFSCEVCNKKLTTIKGMRMHMRKHTGHRPYLCNICGRGFPRSASLRYHIQTHSKKATIPVKCDICDRSFTSEHKLKKHKRFKHPEKRPVWKCDACGKHFTAKRSLKRHEETHQGIRRYVCEFCNRSFFRKEYLTYHLDSHYKGNPDMAHLASKRKRRIPHRQQSVKEESANLLSIYTVEPNMGQEKMYTQLVEMTNPHAWAEGATEVPTVFTLEGGTLQVSEGGTLRVSEGGTLRVTEGGTLQVTEVVDQADSGTALVMVEEGGATTANVTNHNQKMEISHIIMSTDISPQQNTTDPNQLHVSLPDVHQPLQQTQNELTITTTSSTEATPTHIENVETIVDDNVIDSEHQIQPPHHNVVQEVTTQLNQGEDTEHHQELQEQQQQQPDTILATITASGTSSSDGSILNPAEGSSRQIEVRMSNGQKLTLSRTDDGARSGKEGDGVGHGEQMVQYRLECLEGETITEEHLNAFRMLAQASSLLQP